ncbi:MAG: DNA-binding response regulator [Deltaproteobacteria bacterium]|jgi:two-component system response regulator YesN|nr:DNA-binding response regulator [Deltaproteobacteria bacterium]
MTGKVTPINGEVKNSQEERLYRVMIVDTDPLMRQTLISILSKIEGFSVTHSIGNFSTALELVKREAPDIVLIEISLPWLTGLDIASKIIEIDPNITIYTISTHYYFEFVQFARNLKFAGHILKPVAPALIVEIFQLHKQQYKLKPFPVIAKLWNIVKDQTFEEFYYSMSTLSHHLQEETGRNIFNLNNKLYEIHSILSNTNHGEKICSPFPISDPTLLYIDKVVELCLFYVMNSSFIAHSVKNYDGLTRFFSFIDKNISEDINLDILVKNCYISQGHLSRIFKKYFNVSVMDYIHMRKVTLSKIYFLFTNHTVTEVAEYIGYNERSYFSKIFKKFERQTIQEYKLTKEHPGNKAAIRTSDTKQFISEVFKIDLL